MFIVEFFSRMLMLLHTRKKEKERKHTEQTWLKNNETRDHSLLSQLPSDDVLCVVLVFLLRFKRCLVVYLEEVSAVEFRDCVVQS
jgi:hypothetical protein